MNKKKGGRERENLPPQQLRERRFIDLIASEIIHSFNNEIGVIHGYANLALKPPSSNSHNRSFLEEIIESAHRIKESTEKMRVFAGAKRRKFEPANMVSVIGEAVEALQKWMPPSVVIQEDRGMTEPVVSADFDQLREMVINLGKNAFEAMERKSGTLTITLREVSGEELFAEGCECFKEQKYVSLLVHDTGRGMDFKVLEEIYEPFFTYGKGNEHAGLGLTVVRKIVLIHQGKIDVKSRRGKGTTFTIYLPLAGTNEGKTKR